jgi:hypothetical protein
MAVDGSLRQNGLRSLGVFSSLLAIQNRGRIWKFVLGQAM